MATATITLTLNQSTGSYSLSRSDSTIFTSSSYSTYFTATSTSRQTTNTKTASVSFSASGSSLPAMTLATPSGDTAFFSYDSNIISDSSGARWYGYFETVTAKSTVMVNDTTYSQSGTLATRTHTAAGLSSYTREASCDFSYSATVYTLSSAYAKNQTLTVDGVTWTLTNTNLTENSCTLTYSDSLSMSMQLGWFDEDSSSLAPIRIKGAVQNTIGTVANGYIAARAVGYYSPSRLDAIQDEIKTNLTDVGYTIVPSISYDYDDALSLTYEYQAAPALSTVWACEYLKEPTNNLSGIYYKGRELRIASLRSTPLVFPQTEFNDDSWCYAINTTLDSSDGTDIYIKWQDDSIVYSTSSSFSSYEELLPKQNFMHGFFIAICGAGGAPSQGYSNTSVALGPHGGDGATTGLFCINLGDNASRVIRLTFATSAGSPSYIREYIQTGTNLTLAFTWTIPGGGNWALKDTLDIAISSDSFDKGSGDDNYEHAIASHVSSTGSGTACKLIASVLGGYGGWGRACYWSNYYTPSAKFSGESGNYCEAWSDAENAESSDAISTVWNIENFLLRIDSGFDGEIYGSGTSPCWNAYMSDKSAQTYYSYVGGGGGGGCLMANVVKWTAGSTFYADNTTRGEKLYGYGVGGTGWSPVLGGGKQTATTKLIGLGGAIIINPIDPTTDTAGLPLKATI